MGKQGLLKSSYGMNNCQIRCSESSPGGDHISGRRSLEGEYLSNKASIHHGSKNDSIPCSFASKGMYYGRRQMFFLSHVRSTALVVAFMGALFLLDSLMFSIIHSMNLQISPSRMESDGLQGDGHGAYDKQERPPVEMYSQLLNLASTDLTKKGVEPDLSTLWEEPYKEQASAWTPCADKQGSTHQGKSPVNNGFILVSANGGINQQRVAVRLFLVFMVCNAVAVASLLNATLVIPKFLYSNVWNDPSQFGDIYQEEHFINTMKDEVNIVKELPSHLQSLDIEEIGSLITDADIVKEAKPADFIRIILPILQKNGVVHFLGFGNRLGFDPLPFNLQKMRCKCNFHALKFVPKIQQAASLLISRIRKTDTARSLLDNQLLGNFTAGTPPEGHNATREPSKYLALHLRFEIDMVAYSLCAFGGGEDEAKELEAYRKIHFPIVVERLKKTKSVSPAELRKLGKCPLTPEEAGLVLSGLGFKRSTYIYLAGSGIYGGNSRMHALTRLYPNLVTKENLLTPSELAPFRNFSSQLAALDFIACATSDVFAMTDSGSQLSSLVSGYRVYYGDGQAPSIRPNKKRLAAVLKESSTISWNRFQERVTKMIQEDQRVNVRGFGRSVYRQPRCHECMCKLH
ncbi:O-fucosyltransferase 8-like isoform X1 [Papaver somniferum]|uniref:O-fucosyltransferase 8-like isoform X1 n=1 Tax=Papaver somniferum TaxID=3469 RepID=UPI000E6F4E46|nr:O-fucosyltransferase 8-like isoform X1 [Papaver somniferum]